MGKPPGRSVWCVLKVNFCQGSHAIMSVSYPGWAVRDWNLSQDAEAQERSKRGHTSYLIPVFLAHLEGDSVHLSPTWTGLPRQSSPMGPAPHQPSLSLLHSSGCHRETLHSRPEPEDLPEVDSWLGFFPLILTSFMVLWLYIIIHIIV